MYAWCGVSTWEIFPHLTGLLQQWFLLAGLFVAHTCSICCLGYRRCQAGCSRTSCAGVCSSCGQGVQVLEEELFMGEAVTSQDRITIYSARKIFMGFFCSNKRVSHLIFQGQVISTGYCTSKKGLAVLVTVKLFSLSILHWVHPQLWWPGSCHWLRVYTKLS